MKTKVFCWEEEDDLKCARTVRMTTRRQTFVNDEMVTEVMIETVETTEHVMSMVIKASFEEEEKDPEVTAAMSSLYSDFACENRDDESMTFSADIDADVHEIHGLRTGVASDEASVAALLLSKTVEQRYLIWWRYRVLFKQSLTVWVKSKSNYGILLEMLASPLVRRG